jgi:hypothetical protein
MQAEQQAALEDIRRVAALLGKQWVTYDEYLRHGKLGMHKVLRWFGRWNSAVKAAGLMTVSQGTLTPEAPGKRGERGRISDEELRDEFIRVYGELGKVPTRYEFLGKAKFGFTTYINRFGSWRNVVAHCLGEGTGVVSPPREDRPRPVRAQIPPGLEADTRKGRRVFGAPLNFRGLRNEPVNEQGVVLLFGMVAHDLGFLVEAVGTGYPDCRAKQRIKGGQYVEVEIEFEFTSSRFNHDPDKCDLVVCWEHDWPQCPIEVLELKSAIRQLDPRME